MKMKIPMLPSNLKTIDNKEISFEKDAQVNNNDLFPSNEFINVPKLMDGLGMYQS